MSTHREPYVKTAWTFIIMLVLGIAYLQAMPQQANSDVTNNSTDVVIAQIQAEYILGAAALTSTEQTLGLQAAAIDVGSVNQRQCAIAFMIALGDPKVAMQASLSLKSDLHDSARQFTPEQSTIQEQLDILASGGTLQEGHESLESQLGWFGALLDASPEQLSEIKTSAEKKVVIIMGIIICIGFLGIGGFIGLITCLIQVFSGKIKTKLLAPAKRHGIYVEVFAIWLFAFVAIMSVAGLLAGQIAKDDAFTEMIFTLFAFFSSLLVLFWARFRGVSWELIRVDIGWSKGSGFAKECIVGIAGYAMMLPFLGVGILLTLVLIGIQHYFNGGVDPFSGTNSGAHPIIVEIAEGGWQVRILLVALAAIAAPIVEETMFRGLLYRQLRSVSCGLGIALSIILSVLLTSFLFAAIHPQGWVAIPALMGIAVGMNLVREWRGSLIPSMMVHGISNGIVTSMMLVFLS